MNWYNEGNTQYCYTYAHEIYNCKQYGKWCICFREGRENIIVDDFNRTAEIVWLNYPVVNQLIATVKKIFLIKAPCRVFKLK